ncbi:amidohydrolase family protein [Kangiella sediminilitoris]|uniref:Xaa-Pro dipeptidase n=1 Tax=Kangiella sediminilitoris TaxID=1144748 RepID=A0A1B3BB00_9GAMM|nr:amidohydrolase family protein [Kangiella sediminilitoris]AOE49957.1 Xaa-Pro dipeptidase [Kangiella sediminilitoris]
MSRFIYAFLMVLSGLLSFSSQANELKAFAGGTLVDGTGGNVIYDSVILVENDRIVAVGTESSLDIPSEYEVISTEGMTVLPGLWDMHVHLMINGHSDYKHWDKAYIDKLGTEIMPASAEQLLLAGVTSARDLGAPLKESKEIKDKIQSGELSGPRMFMSGPFIQHKPYPGTEAFRWGVESESDAKRKVRQLKEAGMDVVKLIDHDVMPLEHAKAVVDEAHRLGMKVVGHSHKPDEIRIGLKIGIDNFEHTGLTTAPEYPEDIMIQLKERTAKGRISGGPLYWTPTVEGLWNYEYVRENHEALDNKCWKRGLTKETVKDIKQSIQHPERISYMQLTPKRKPTLKTKFNQLRKSGAILLVGTDSGIPMKFHCQSTWNELDVWVREFDVPVMEAIQAATLWPAKFMGVDKDLGTVVPGKYADIIAVKGDVLKYINLLQDVDLVVKGGVIYKRDGKPNEKNLTRKYPE